MHNRVLLVKKRSKVQERFSKQDTTTHNTIFSAHACSEQHDLAKYISQKNVCFVSFNNRLSESSEVASIFKQNNS